MAGTTPSPVTWTLRFKHKISTVVLHVDPLQSFASIREELLLALQETHTDGKLHDKPIPDNADHLLLARPNDMNDVSLGFTSVVDDDGNLILEVEPANKKRKTDGGEFKLKDQTPKAAGLRDGCILAFKFRDESGTSLAEDDDWDVQMPSLDDGLEG